MTFFLHIKSTTTKYNLILIFEPTNGFFSQALKYTTQEICDTRNQITKIIWFTLNSCFIASNRLHEKNNSLPLQIFPFIRMKSLKLLLICTMVSRNAIRSSPKEVGQASTTFIAISQPYPNLPIIPRSFVLATPLPSYPLSC